MRCQAPFFLFRKFFRRRRVRAPGGGAPKAVRYHEFGPPPDDQLRQELAKVGVRNFFACSREFLDVAEGTLAAATPWSAPVKSKLEAEADSGLTGQPSTVADQQELQRLMEGYQRADEDAAARLIEKLSPMLLRFLAGPLMTRSQAEDMLQECWLRIHKARRSYRPGTPVLPWVFAIARYTRVDTYRRRRQVDAREWAAENLESSTQASVGPPDYTDLDLWKLVHTLPRSQQDVVYMLKVSGMSLEEVARATGSSVGAVKQKAHRAYRKLRELLSESGAESGVK